MSTDPTMPVDLPPSWKIWLKGIVIGDVSIGLLYGACALLQTIGVYDTLVIPSLFLVPLLGGLIASYFWRTLQPRIGATILNTFWMTFLALAGSTIAFHEGVICLLIVSPLFYLLVLTGACLGRIWFRTDTTRLRVTLLPCLAVAILAEPMTRIDTKGVVVDELVIHAPAAKVWREVTSFPEIPSAPKFWLFRMGLPYPVATTSAGDFVNADRKCIFSHDAIFTEKIVELVPQEKLTFDILESPPDPELIGHLTPHRGQFVLRSNADGTTTLIGSTWYTLHVRPVWYFDWWTQHIFRAVHLRVMEDVRRRAES